MEDPNQKTEMKTLISCMQVLKREGFKEDFMVKDKKLQSYDGSGTYTPEEVKILNFYRFEGESDPADNAILYAIETSDGHKGLLSDAYGVYADNETTKFIASVEEINKRTS